MKYIICIRDSNHICRTGLCIDFYKLDETIFLLNLLINTICAYKFMQYCG